MSKIYKRYLEYKNLKNKIKLDSINIFNILFIAIAALSLFFLTKGDIREVNSDFDLYFNPIKNFLESNCQGLECTSYFLPSEKSWIPTPFYSLFFLIPITIFNSDKLFLLQGFILTLIILYQIRFLLSELYSKSIDTRLINILVLVGCFNINFIKDSLTSGTMSVCTLFVLLSIRFRRNSIVSLIWLCLAAITRSNYIFMSFSALLALNITKIRNFKKYTLVVFSSILIYLIHYKFFYYSYPGSPYIGLFKTGFVGSDIIVNFFLERLPVNESIFYWQPSLKEVIMLIFNNLSLLYGVFVNYIFKLMNFLGFMHMGFFIDNRELWFQKLIELFNFLLFYGPAFYILVFITALRNIFKIRLFNNEEEFLIYSTLLYILFHNFYLGSGRYLIGYNFY